MAGRVYTITHPRTEWFKRVAVRLLERSPQMTPLEAMRRAMEAFPDSQYEDPDTVASALMEGNVHEGRSPHGPS